MPIRTAAEAAGLAHVLGHPPFGQVAEEELDLQVKTAHVKDGFEGNAQSLTKMARLESLSIDANRAEVPSWISRKPKWKRDKAAYGEAL